MRATRLIVTYTFKLNFKTKGLFLFSLISSAAFTELNLAFPTSMANGATIYKFEEVFKRSLNWFCVFFRLIQPLCFSVKYLNLRDELD